MDEKSLIIIDDQADNVFVLDRVIRELLPGCLIMSSTNALDGLAMIKATLPDAVLVDLQMPKMDGIEVCRALKADQTTHHIPIVLITSHQTSARKRVAALEAGADDFLIRPIDNHELIARIKVLFRVKAAEDRLRALNIDLDEKLTQRNGQLRAAEERYRWYIDNAPYGIFVVDSEGNYLDVNRAACAMAGYPRGTLLQGGIQRLATAESVAEGFPIFNQVRERGRVSAEAPIKHADGTRRYWTVDAVRLVDDTIVAFCGDITERKQNADLLRQNETLFRTLAESAPVGIFKTDANGECVYANHKWCELAGMPPDRALGRGWEKALFPDDRERVANEWYEAATGGTEFNSEYRFATTDGKVSWLSGRAAPLRGKDGQITGYVGTIADITTRVESEKERTELESMLRQSQKMESIGRLAGGVAHDFNNLLSPIVYYAESLLNQFQADDPNRHGADQILEAATRAAALTKQLLAFGRKQILEVKPIVLTDVVDHLLPMLRRLLREDIEFVQHHDHLSPTIEADVVQIEQILINLAINAQDAMPDGGTITLHTGSVELTEHYCKEHPGLQPGSFVLLAVSDTGHGMDSPTMEHIFEPFFTTKKRGDGTGLGLATVHGIVRQHGGHIDVESQPGAGTTFKIYMRESTRSRRITSNTPAAPQYDGQQRPVLLVEDDDVVRSSTRLMLERLGHQVVEATDGPAAMKEAQLRTEPFCLLLTDVVLPTLKGPDLYRQIAEQMPETLVLYMSGYAEEAIARHGIIEDGVNFIQKPFTRKDLKSKLQQVLG